MIAGTGARRVRPPRPKNGLSTEVPSAQPQARFSASLSFFLAKHFTVFEAGLALKTQGSLVKGLMPFRAFVAAFTFNFIFSIPATLKEPCFLTSVEAMPMYAAVAVIPCFLAPFIAFIAFGGSMAEV